MILMLELSACTICPKNIFSGIFFSSPAPRDSYKVFDEKIKKNPELKANYQFVGQVLENPELLCSIRKDKSRTMYNRLLYNKSQKKLDRMIGYIRTFGEIDYKITRDTVYNDSHRENNIRIEYQRHILYVECNNKIVSFTFLKHSNEWLCFNIQVGRSPIIEIFNNTVHLPESRK